MLNTSTTRMLALPKNNAALRHTQASKKIADASLHANTTKF